MFQRIKDKIKDKSLIIFGEIHGTKEIPELLSRFFSEIAKEEDFNVCLEIPEEFQNQMNFFMESGNFHVLEGISFFYKENCSDGRNSLDYIRLIESIHRINLTYNKKIQIFCIDPLANSQDEKEIGLSENILKTLNNKKTFVILGDIHASKKEIILGNMTIVPASFLIYKKIKEKMINIRIAPKNKELNDEEKDFNKGFDYIVEIPDITSCSFLQH